VIKLSYTESDIIKRIYKNIEKDYGINTIIKELINWYEYELEYFKVNNWNTKDLEEKIKILKEKLR